MKTHRVLGLCLAVVVGACRTEGQPETARAAAPPPTEVAPSAQPEDEPTLAAAKPDDDRAREPEPESEPEPEPAPELAAAPEGADAQDEAEADAADADADAPADAEPTAEAVADADTKPDDPAADTALRPILILGDSLAATGFGAVLERRLDETDGLVCYRKGKSASGLARPDFFDWFDEGKRQVDEREPELVVVILGGNDGQDLTRRKRSDDKRVRWKTEGWEDEYRRRMDAFIGEISAPGRKILWLGLPTMGITSFERKLELIRRIQKEAVEAADNATYLDTTPFMSDENGKMLTDAPVGDKRKPQPIRASDRIHFTMPGSHYFADHVYPDVLAALGLAR
jgi:hypothetical protein